MKTILQPSCKIPDLRWRAVSAELVFAVIVLTTVVATPSAQAQSFTPLANIGPQNPYGYAVPGVVLDAAGNLYGTTGDGGITGGVCGQFGCGTVFKVDTTGTVTALYKFTGGTDGRSPLAGLVQDAAGTLYGATGAAVFKLDTSGTFTVLHSGGTQAGLLLDAAGNLYGTTEYGGVTAGMCGNNGCGTVFRLDTAGTYTVLYSFTGEPDGAYPVAGLVQDAAGTLYGTTEGGGITGGGCGSSGCGTVFKLDASNKETVLYRFTGAPDGATPIAGVVQDAAGDLYGTTYSGGLLDCFEPSGSNPPSNKPIYCGVVFKVDTTGTETVLHSFAGIPDGALPQAALVLDPSGDLYGTTTEGGSNGFFGCQILNPSQPTGCGTIFKLDTIDNTVSVVYSFSGNEDGGYPEAGLVLDAAGNLYGTALSRVFKFDTLGPPNFDLTVLPSGHGSGTLAINGTNCPGSACSEFFAKGTQVALTAMAAAGSSFSGWSAPCSGTGTCRLTVNSADLVFATFDMIQADFSLSAPALTPGTVSPGGSSTSIVNVAAVGGFSGSVDFTCSVTPAPALAPTCSISPTSVTLNGTTARNVTVSVSTTARSQGAPRVPPMPLRHGPFGLIGWILVLMGGLLARVLRAGRPRRAALIFAPTLLLVVAWVACGGGGGGGGGAPPQTGTPAETYTLTVTGTYTGSTPNLSHTLSLTLTVN